MTHSAFLVSHEAYGFFKGLKETGEITGEWLEKLEPVDFYDDSKFELSSAEVAQLAGVVTSRIRQLAPEMAKAGHAKKTGNAWKFAPEAARWVIDHPDGRSRKK